jgi:hypothetical protein
MNSRLVLISLFSLLAACGRPESEPEVPLTYYGQIKPILDTQCAGCHVEGEVAPFALDNAADAKQFASVAVASVEAGRMPPWQPDSDCREYEGERVLSDTAKATLRAWLDEGAPVGDAPSATGDSAPETGGQQLGLEGATVFTGIPAPYTPVQSQDYPDDYRCFLLDTEFAEDSYIIDEQVFPDARALVHHVLVYVVPPEKVAEIVAMDEADEGQGYECFGGPGVDQDRPVGAWVPGYTRPPRAGLAGFEVPAGSRLVMQMHYSTLTASPSPDQTRLELITSTEPPKFLLDIRSMPYLDMLIPAGDANSVQRTRFRNDEDAPWIMAGVAPHMHLLGTSIRVDAVRKNGDKECMIEIPDWDFSWQQSYSFKEAMFLEPGEEIELTCTYDNSAEHQPTLNGERVTPRDVRWGEQTLDEMCLTYLITVEES